MAVDSGAGVPPRMDLASSLHGRCAAARSPSWQHRVRLWVVEIDPSGWHAEFFDSLNPEKGERSGLFDVYRLRSLPHLSCALCEPKVGKAPYRSPPPAAKSAQR